MPTKKKNTPPTPHVAKRNSCTACKAWGIVGGIIMVLLGIALLSEVLSLEYTVATVLILTGIAAIIGGGMQHKH